MRLLSVDRSHDGHLEVECFQGEPEPYAILSHRWGGDEVQFADLNNPNVATKKGYQKIQWTLQQARKAGLHYAWVDTCCIDKSSSAELSEAINAMYAWYRDAAVCYAFIEDVTPQWPDDWHQAFRASKWFTRGWTLQELLAPKTMYFFDSGWADLGTKLNLNEDIHAATGITADYLNGDRSVFSASVARRMSWAARRVTTRKEDVAYCLMGIFEVNMPMLYGEGEKAFIRLQEEIMRSSDDQTLFAWQDDHGLSMHRVAHSGLLAHEPLLFANTGDMIPHASAPAMLFAPIYDRVGTTAQRHETHVVTNRGIRIDLVVAGRTIDLRPDHGIRGTREGEDQILALLACAPEHEACHAAIALEPTGESRDHFARAQTNKLFRLSQVPMQNAPRPLFVRQRQTQLQRTNAPFHYIQFWGDLSGSASLQPDTDGELGGGDDRRHSIGVFADVIGEQGHWFPDKTIAIPKGSNMLSAYVSMHYPKPEDEFVLLIGSDEAWKLGFDVWRPTPSATWEESSMWAYRDQQTSIPPELQDIFRPRPPGTRMLLEKLAVVVDVATPYNATFPSGTNYITLHVTPESESELRTF